MTFSIDLLSHPLTITLYSVHLSVQCRGLYVCVLGEVKGVLVKQYDVTTRGYHHYNILQLFGPLGSEGGVYS